MSKPKDKPPTLAHRAITSLQSTGRIGQSTTKQGIISWLGFASIPFQAIDADDVHRTLFRWYPDNAVLRPFRDENGDDLLAILNEPGEAPVRVLDFPSQKTPSILHAFEHFEALSLFDAAEHGQHPGLAEDATAA